jgi:hypothetical protein
MAIDYVEILRALAEEREGWAKKRDEALRELSRLAELIRATVKMLTPEQRAKCDALLERIDRRPAGLTTSIRLCFTAAEKEWMTPVEIRDKLIEIGFQFEMYKANPLASIHTTLKRMVPGEVECKTVGGEKVYRLKTLEQWKAAMTEAREWVESLAGKGAVAVSTAAAARGWVKRSKQ